MASVKYVLDKVLATINTVAGDLELPDGSFRDILNMGVETQGALVKRLGGAKQNLVSFGCICSDYTTKATCEAGGGVWVEGANVCWLGGRAIAQFTPSRFDLGRIFAASTAGTSPAGTGLAMFANGSGTPGLTETEAIEQGAVAWVAQQAWGEDGAYAVSVDNDAPTGCAWFVVPTAEDEDSITMSVTEATDPSGVEYYFECTVGGGHDSGWQDETTYTDTDLTGGTTYTYRWKCRDKSPQQNATDWSSEQSATTEELPLWSCDFEGDADWYSHWGSIVKSSDRFHTGAYSSKVGYGQGYGGPFSSPTCHIRCYILLPEVFDYILTGWGYTFPGSFPLLWYKRYDAANWNFKLSSDLPNNDPGFLIPKSYSHWYQIDLYSNGYVAKLWIDSIYKGSVGNVGPFAAMSCGLIAAYGYYYVDDITIWSTEHDPTLE